MADKLIFTGLGDPAQDRNVSRLFASGKLARLHVGIYTDNLKDPPEAVALRNWAAIASRLFGPAIMSGISAVEFMPTAIANAAGKKTGYLFLTDPTSNRRRTVAMLGLEIRALPGIGPQQGDYPFLGLTMASVPRALLENLAPSRRRGTGPARTVGPEDVEAKLDRICSQEGEEHLNRIRDQARTLAPILALTKEFQKLDGIIGMLLGTRKAHLVSKVAKARAAGRPYDPACVLRLTTLRKHLDSVALPARPDTSAEPSARTAISFIEAYFSNYIEGTRFPVKQARRIVFDNEQVDRPEDGHDVSSTYAQLVGLGARLPSSLAANQLIEEIKARHADLMSVRPSKSPGEFKKGTNVAGNTTFVAPSYVVGTLEAGVDILNGITHPFGRAAFLHFLLTDVHPFADGNGRISRIMMTKELVGSGFSRVVVPTVYREDYVGALRALSRRNDPGPSVRALDFCQRVTAAAAAADIDAAIEVWASTFAFVEAGGNARLSMPDPARTIAWKDEVPAPEEYWAADNAPVSDIKL